jgi:RNA polymerase sigma-54 factor
VEGRRSVVKAALQIGLSQSLKLTPQLTQAIKLLAMSTLELELEVTSLLESNPVLEREEDLPGDDYGDEPAPTDDREPESGDEIDDRLDLQDYEDFGDWNEPANASSSFDGEDGERERAADAPDLRAELAWQLALCPLSERDRGIAAVLVDAVDDDGYLREDEAGILAALPASWSVTPEEVAVVRTLLQQCDPPGVGARDLRECLLLQLRQKPGDHLRDLALRIVADHLQTLAKTDSAQLARRLGASVADVDAALRLIRSLKPRPGERPSDSDDDAVIPDLIARKINGRWRVQLNPTSTPGIGINRQYERMAAESKGDAGSYLRGRLQEARWLMKSLQQRGDTLLKVGNCIVREQGAFLDYGPEALRPLTLRAIAEEVGLHESTISRATTRKYMATPRGVFELKRFFSSGVATSEGGEASATAIQAMLRKLIDTEQKTRPLSDQALADALKRAGIPVARRTVAKYREAMNIPASSDRLRKA